jgi:hypothetical protein
VLHGGVTRVGGGERRETDRPWEIGRLGTDGEGELGGGFLMRMGEGVGSNACTRRRIGTIVCSIAWSWLCVPAEVPRPSLLIE